MRLDTEITDEENDRYEYEEYLKETGTSDGKENLIGEERTKGSGGCRFLGIFLLNLFSYLSYMSLAPVYPSLAEKKWNLTTSLVGIVYSIY